MNIKSNEIIKYTFMVIPFKFYEDLNFSDLLESSFFREVDHTRIKYDRLYKHIAASIDSSNKERTIFDLWVNKEIAFVNIFDKILKFKIENDKGEKCEVEGYFKDIFVHMFKNGIGFITINLVFDDKMDIDTFCELTNKLKKINRDLGKSRLEIIDEDNRAINIYEIISLIKNNLCNNCDLFFQHSSEKYVSAIMLNSFTYIDTPDENIIMQKLEFLKRSQSLTYGTSVNDKTNNLRPFKNMFWAFSTQGVANINYNDPNVGNLSFYKTFYKNVKREYLLMMLIILNQEYTLLDYCQLFSKKANNLPNMNELNRLYEFKIHNTFTTISHLEHYRTFYNNYSKELGIDRILDEVNTKQNAIYLTHKNRITDEKIKREKKINKFTKILSVILSIFGITGLINNVANLVSRDNILIISGIVLGVVIASVVLVMIISYFLDKKFSLKLKTQDKRKK